MGIKNTTILLALLCAIACDQQRGATTEEEEEGASEIFGQAGTFTDSRDGREYRAVRIGDQLWMAENLNYETSASGCNDHYAPNCATYGRLYAWDDAKKACPRGWHLPSDEDWSELINVSVGKEQAGKRLKSTAGWSNKRDSTSGSGTDDFGFSALPGGSRAKHGHFDGIGWGGRWWSATAHGAHGAGYVGMYNNYDRVYEDRAATTSSYTEGGGWWLSVRCVRDVGAVQVRAPRLGNTGGASSFTDPRDGQKYRTVKIENLTWMAENLNFKARGSSCYGYADSYCEKYGRLYTRNAARRACPSGWRLPRFDDWGYLVQIAGGDSVAGKRLKSGAGWGYYEDIGRRGGGTDEFGFSALPGGIQHPVDGSLGAGRFGTWWSTTKYGIDNAAYFYHVGKGDAVFTDPLGERHRLSVRCVKAVDGGGGHIDP